jgi:hypothetical protein
LQDGFLTGRPYALAQTNDGFLWIGTQDGLIRFDGVRFVPILPPVGGKQSSFRVDTLRAARDGSLWIGGFAGLMHWADHKLIKYPDSVGRVTAIIQRSNGEIWFTRFRQEDQKGGALCRVVGLQTQCYGQEHGVVLIGGGPLMEDPSGFLWSGDVRDEVYRIGYEAIQNAKAHSHASSLSIDLSYAQDLVLRIRDNGVGIDPNYVIVGKESHHGLQGMRERAAHVQGKLTILSSMESGTEVSLIVPGSVSYLLSETGILATLRKLYRGVLSKKDTR